MKKKKIVVYGEPGTGKSVFATGAENPFFICTDGNYEWLLDFGAAWENHVQVFSWSQIKKIFASPELEKYDTIVVDLLEDAYKWCEQEICITNKWSHINDPGYGKGYDMVNNEFFIEIGKLLNMDKNIILIMHGETQVTKDKRGIEHSKFVPSSRIRAKCIDMIEGRVRYFLRAYAVSETDPDGNLVTNRYLSLSPDGTTEFGILRGISKPIPRDIPLDWKTFSEVVENASGPVNITPTATKINLDEIPVVKPSTNMTRTKSGITKLDSAPTNTENTKNVEVAVHEPMPEQKTPAASKEDTTIVSNNGVLQMNLETNTEEVTEAPKAAVKKTKAEELAEIKAKLAKIKADKNNK